MSLLSCSKILVLEFIGIFRVACIVSIGAGGDGVLEKKL